MKLLALLATTTSDVIGKISPPVDDPLYSGDVNTSLGKIISLVLQFFFFVAGIAVFLYMLLGAYDWIVSGGEKEKILKAQNKIQSAAIGLLILISVVVLFNVLMVTVLGGKFGFTNGPNGLQFTLPHL